MTSTVTRAPDSEEPEAEVDVPASEDTGKKKKKKSNLIPALIIAVALIVGAYLMKPAPAGGEAKEEEKVEEVIPGEIATIESMTLNLADGHYLMLGLGMELVEGVPAKEFAESGETDKFKDLIIAKVGDMTVDQVSTTEGREALKETLRHGAKELYPDEFIEIYLTEAVVQ